jgi:polyisoprenoid-binding protein YceI
MKRTLVACALITSGLASAEPVVYEIDPSHTYPSFEGDHMAGLSTWRGKFNRTTGKVMLDRAAGTGTVEATIDVASIDFGHDEVNAHALSAEFFDVAAHPQATYTGRLERFVDGAPTKLVGELDLHGVKRPVSLEIRTFKCMEHPMLKREVCGADAVGTFNRDEFGLTAGKDYGFSMNVTLRIQVEAVQAP